MPGCFVRAVGDVQRARYPAIHCTLPTAGTIHCCAIFANSACSALSSFSRSAYRFRPSAPTF